MGVGQITRDTRPSEGHNLPKQRLNETEVGRGTTVTLIDGQQSPDRLRRAAPHQVASWLGLQDSAQHLVAWDAFDAVLAPGDIILLLTLRDREAAEAFEAKLSLQEGARCPARPRGARLPHVRPARGSAVLSSMLLLNPETGRYDAVATSSTGTETLFDFYRRLANGDATLERGDHAVF